VNSKIVTLDGESLSIAKISSLTSRGLKVKVPPTALKKVQVGHDFLSQATKANDKIIYGVNTGFGPMANFILAKTSILDLQKNLIVSHAVGMGEKIEDEFVLAAMVIRLNTLLRGYSAVSPALLKHIQTFINHRIIPLVPEHGAVGTSGDLVQLAHVALTFLGKGKVVYKNKLVPTDTLLKRLKIKPYTLKPKEGLALINGTSMMTGIAALTCAQANKLLDLSIRGSCLSLELVKGYKDSFSEKLHELRPHPGQVAVAAHMRKLLAGSPFIRSRMDLAKHANHSTHINQINDQVQEIYSLRCVAQILGPVHDTLNEASNTVETEMNSVTDNPIVDWSNNKFLHGGNFHGDYIAVRMDQLKISLVKLTMLSERRLNFFLNHKINKLFPPFLNLATPGLTLGLQALQFVATSTTAHNQTLAYPMNLHSISTNADNQDVVSMGTDAALLTHKVLENAYIVVAIELIALAQAVDFLNISDQISTESKNLYKFIRSHIRKIESDRELQSELATFLTALKNF
jgi:phenylalanine ammonia-lyase